jgi:transcriptional regulator with XRE-family HTH domain
VRSPQLNSISHSPAANPLIAASLEAFAEAQPRRPRRRISVSDTGTPLRFATGRRLRALRIERGLSQIELAAAAGCGSTHVSEIETGKANCNLDTLDELCVALNVDIVQLFSEDAEPGTDCALAKERLPVNLRKLRVKRGMSQFELAEKANLNRTYVGKVENSVTSLNLDRVNELARGLGVDASELFTRRKPRYRNKPVRGY